MATDKSPSKTMVLRAFSATEARTSSVMGRRHMRCMRARTIDRFSWTAGRAFTCVTLPAMGARFTCTDQGNM